MKKIAGIALVALAVVTLSQASAAAHGRTERLKSSLTATGVDLDARGRAQLLVRNGSEARFEIFVERLEPQATYEVLVNDIAVGQLATSDRGRGRIRFRSRPRARRDELLGFDPRGALVAIRNANGEDVLALMLAGSGSPSGEDDVICCLPDDRGPQCEDRTAAECVAQGGTLANTTSCLPNPCAGVPPPPVADVICCIPDDSGPECEDRTPAQCAQQGGVVVEAAACNPNPCAPVAPPADSDIQCCLPDDSGPECEDRTPAQCAAQGGVNMGPGTCTPNPCTSTTPPPAGTATVRVTCERRASRSKISVDGNDLASGSYQARVSSGANTATAPARPTIGDEVEFDFDSDAGDIAAGATPIAAAFIQGTPPQVTGTILDASGNVVVEATADCRDQ